MAVFRLQKTVFSNKEEAFAENEYFKGHLKFYAADALAVAGGIVINNDGLFVANVVRDRELITGQNPPSDREIAETLLRALNEDSVKVVRPNRMSLLEFCKHLAEGGTEVTKGRVARQADAAPKVPRQIHVAFQSRNPVNYTRYRRSP